jgi:hypothetical protein
MVNFYVKPIRRHLEYWKADGSIALKFILRKFVKCIEMARIFSNGRT